MLKEELKMTQILEIISHPTQQEDEKNTILHEIREYRIPNPKLWDQIVKMFHQK